MSEKHRILAVDDEPFNLEIIEELLEDKYHLNFATSGEECLSIITESPVDLILLDVGLPGSSGLEICRKLKSDPATQDIPIIFISALTSAEERRAGFEAGGQDYINKPFCHNELKTKIQLLTDIRAKVSDLNKNVQYATGTAMAAMSSAGELGVVLHFLRESFLCKNLASLTQKALDALTQYGLSSTIQLRVNNECFTLGHEEKIPDIEYELFALVASSDCRIHSFGSRSIFNFDPVIILVKNMPVDDEALLGRQRDNIAILAEGLQARLEALLLQIEVDQQKSLLWGVIEKTENALDRIAQHHEAQQRTQSELIDGLSEKMTAAFHELQRNDVYLSEQDEELLLDATRSVIRPATALYESGLELGQQLGSILSEIKGTLGSSPGQ